MDEATPAFEIDFREFRFSRADLARFKYPVAGDIWRA
jgi:hypothetical protein